MKKTKPYEVQTPSTCPANRAGYVFKSLQEGTVVEVMENALIMEARSAIGLIFLEVPDARFWF